MKQRAAFLAALALGAIMAGATLNAAAQQPGKVFRIGILSPAERSSTKIFDAFRATPLTGRNHTHSPNRGC